MNHLHSLISVTQIKIFLLTLIGIPLILLIGIYSYQTVVFALNATSGQDTKSPALKTSETDFFANRLANIEQTKLEAELKAAKDRQDKIDRVEAFFASYGSELQGYGHIIVDKAAECGGDYRILVGIAGSESGLGRIMYKRYNPYGYLDGVQYANQKEALEILSCKVSSQHIAPCGQDLTCLANRYAGPQDDLSHFISKVRWFMNQV